MGIVLSRSPAQRTVLAVVVGRPHSTARCNPTHPQIASRYPSTSRRTPLGFSIVLVHSTPWRAMLVVSTRTRLSLGGVTVTERLGIEYRNRLSTPSCVSGSPSSKTKVGLHDKVQHLGRDADRQHLHCSQVALGLGMIEPGFGRNEGVRAISHERWLMR